jgi:diadenosine tetraphosphate (Ap4A) HIT family hydrolase
MPDNAWPSDVPALRPGEGCTMCGPGAEETPHGLRVIEGHASVIWKGRHVAEPTGPSAVEAAGFCSEVAPVAGVVEAADRPTKMNWFSLGNGVPHLHVHLVPRPVDDARPGWPVETGAFDVAAIPALDPSSLASAAAPPRARRQD